LDTLLDLQDAQIGYERELPLFAGINLTISRGVHACFVGPCGVGKTSIIKTVMGLLTLGGGAYYAFGRDMGRPSAAVLSYVRKKIGVLPDRGILLEHLNVFENIALPLRHGQLQTMEKISQSLEPLLEEFNLAPILNRYPSTLNLDQIKKVGFVRAIMNNPDLLILDDPFEGLDDGGVHTLRDFLSKVNVQGISTIVIFSRKTWDWPEFFTNRYHLSQDGVSDVQ
jgi:ABC-type transporter Mla maintaining outer membrane lipid asymmetry ATPase subunit MlaF